MITIDLSGKMVLITGALGAIAEHMVRRLAASGATLVLTDIKAERVAVMYLGKLCETGPGEAVYREPLHPYTRALLDSIPSTEPGAARASTVIQGEPPSPINPPSGCRFRTRCPRATDLCAEEEPRPRELAAGHVVACHFPLNAPPPAESAESTSAENGTARTAAPPAAKVQG